MYLLQVDKFNLTLKYFLGEALNKFNNPYSSNNFFSLRYVSPEGNSIAIDKGDFSSLIFSKPRPQTLNPSKSLICLINSSEI